MNLQELTNAEFDDLQVDISKEYDRRLLIQELINFPEGTNLPIKIIEIKDIIYSMSGRLKRWIGTVEIDGKLFKNKEFACRTKYSDESNLKINKKIYRFNWNQYFYDNKIHHPDIQKLLDED
jgi:hypothetical protein